MQSKALSSIFRVKTLRELILGPSASRRSLATSLSCCLQGTFKPCPVEKELESEMSLELSSMASPQSGSTQQVRVQMLLFGYDLLLC